MATLITRQADGPEEHFLCESLLLVPNYFCNAFKGSTPYTFGICQDSRPAKDIVRANLKKLAKVPVPASHGIFQCFRTEGRYDCFESHCREKRNSR